MRSLESSHSSLDNGMVCLSRWNVTGDCQKSERLRGSLARNLRLTSQNLACCPAPCRDRPRQKKEISRRVVGAKGDTDWPRHVPPGFQHVSTFPEPRLAQNSHQQSSDALLPKGMETKVGPLREVQWVLPPSSASLHLHTVPPTPWPHKAMGLLLSRFNTRC